MLEEVFKLEKIFKVNILVNIRLIQGYFLQFPLNDFNKRA